MGLKNWQGQGPNYVPAYQASGTPYVTSSGDMSVTATPERVRFPYVTRWVQVTNTSDNPLRVGFSANGINGVGGSVSGSYHETSSPADDQNYFILSGALGNAPSTLRLELRCKEMYFRRHSGVNTGFSLIAGLTGISHNQFPVLTGSAGFQGIG